MTTSHFVVIDNEHFPVAEGDQDAMRQRIIDAVRAGGDFVTLRRDATRIVEVLVTPATAVHLEHIAHSDFEARSHGVDDAEGRLMGEDLQWWLDTIE